MERGFILKLHEKSDAPLSPIFLNLRTPDNPKPGPLTPEIVNLAASCMQALELEKRLTFDAIVGVPQAGELFATAFSSTCRETMYPSREMGVRREHDCITGVKGNVPPCRSGKS